ncbi:hypothetical protein KPH14_000852 [Odynerus spinipes]|uniref:Uncharacterized protein n=1 Tax=Odynerus spinipes TaxID=1348599 RepID=A0AAD9RDB4_9HYME|nr:hypothetical protein KPH14_000852 [Odynerus spinipes]
MYSRRKSLVSVISGNLGKEIILENKTITDELQELFKFYRNYMFNMTGRLYNASEKRERNITSEVAINSLQFDVVHNDFMFYLEKSINDFNQLFGENASIKTLKDINSEKEMEMQAMNMLHQGVDKEEGNKDE